MNTDKSNATDAKVIKPSLWLRTKNVFKRIFSLETLRAVLKLLGLIALALLLATPAAAATYYAGQTYGPVGAVVAAFTAGFATHLTIHALYERFNTAVSWINRKVDRFVDHLATRKMIKEKVKAEVHSAEHPDAPAAA